MKYQNVKQEIKTRQAHSQGIHKQIQATHGDERARLWEKKREYGTKTRWILLGYAFLRGVPYRVVEKTRRHSWDNDLDVHRALKELGFEASREDIKAWFQVAPKVEEEVAA